MGLGEFIGVNCFIWLVEVSFGFRYLTPLVFFSTPFNLLVPSLSVEGCKRINEGREKRKETKIGIFVSFLLNFNFTLGLILLLCNEKSSWTIREQSRLPNKELKCTSHFRWLIRPNSVLSYAKCETSSREKEKSV